MSDFEFTALFFDSWQRVLQVRQQQLTKNY